MKAWLRELKIILTSTKFNKRLTFGTDYDKKGDNLSIRVQGHKFLSALKDNFTVTINNLTYKEIVELIDGQYYDVEIKCGYRSSGIHTIFKGSVLYISNDLGDRKTNSVIILCASKLVATYGQKRMNLGLQSGINMYSALNYICKKAGIPNSNISEEFKNRIVNESSNVTSTVSSFLETLTSTNKFVINSDSIFGADVSIWNPYRTDNRVIKLDSSTIILTSGYPTLSSDGLTVTLMPTFAFMPGDTIQIDNSLIDISVTSKEQAFKNPSYFLDPNSRYMVYEMTYTLENRGHSFELEMICKSRGLISRISGVEGYN